MREVAVLVVLAGAMFSGCAAERLTVTKDVSIYEIERSSFSPFWDISDVTKLAYKAVEQECMERHDPNRVAQPTASNDGLKTSTDSSSAVSHNSRSATVEQAGDVVAFAEQTQDFLDIFFPRIRVRMSMKCRDGAGSHATGTTRGQ